MYKLIIVESPSKIKTLKKYLGSDYEIVASYGHVTKLKTSGIEGLGINTETWEANFGIDPAKKKYVKEIQEKAKKASKILIATDPDREGEAIGAYLLEILKSQNNYERIIYNEITKPAVLKALDNPQKINQDLVDAQITRRLMDRIIGFKLSGLLTKKVFNYPIKPSAGRVQSIALKLVVDKEKEIENFQPQFYAKISALLKGYNFSLQRIDALTPFENKTYLTVKKARKEMEILQQNGNQPLKLFNIEIKKTKEKNPEAYKQATVFKEAKMSSNSVKNSLQNLYEGYGDGGLISYPRTDSTRLSDDFILHARAYIFKTFGKEYINEKIKGKKGVQDAHEAIRPTDLNLTPEKAKSFLSENDFKIYNLIYTRTMKVLMKPAIFEVANYFFSFDNMIFSWQNASLVFDGFYKFLGYDYKQEIKVDSNVFQLNKVFTVQKYILEEKQTKPPARYSDGSLIDMLDKIGVGRPSTFASTLAIIKKRLYVDFQDKKFFPSEYGKIIINYLIENFSQTINESYTAFVENQLDQIAEGKIFYKDVLNQFWQSFEKNFLQVKQEVVKIELSTEKIEVQCPECGNFLKYRYNKKGVKFIGCSQFPTCRFVASETALQNGKLTTTKKIQEHIEGFVCEKCQASLVKRYSDKRKQHFIGCSQFPKCKFAVNVNYFENHLPQNQVSSSFEPEVVNLIKKEDEKEKIF